MSVTVKAAIIPTYEPPFHREFRGYCNCHLYFSVAALASDRGRGAVAARDVAVAAGVGVGEGRTRMLVTVAAAIIPTYEPPVLREFRGYCNCHRYYQAG